MSSILLEDRSVVDLLTGKHTFVNQRLAQHYGIQGVNGTQFRRIELTDETRFGLLGKAAVLMRTSYPDRTSPVLRGAWVLGRIKARRRRRLLPTSKRISSKRPVKNRRRCANA